MIRDFQYKNRNLQWGHAGGLFGLFYNKQEGDEHNTKERFFPIYHLLTVKLFFVPILAKVLHDEDFPNKPDRTSGIFRKIFIILLGPQGL